MKFGYLADYPEFVEKIAIWFQAEWGARYPERSLEDWQGQVYLNKDHLPITLVGFEEAEDGSKSLLSTATLRRGGMDIHPELETWLSYVFTDPDKRGKGYASSMVIEALRFAQEMGIKFLHLFTRTNGNVYRRLGWIDVERTEYKGGPVIVMSRKLELTLSASTAAVIRGLEEKSYSPSEMEP